MAVQSSGGPHRRRPDAESTGIHTKAYAAETNNSQVLQAKNVLKYNNKFQELIDRYGVSLDCKQAVSEWNEWFREMAQFV